MPVLDAASWITALATTATVVLLGVGLAVTYLAYRRNSIDAGHAPVVFKHRRAHVRTDFPGGEQNPFFNGGDLAPHIGLGAYRILEIYLYNRSTIEQTVTFDNEYCHFWSPLFWYKLKLFQGWLVNIPISFSLQPNEARNIPLFVVCTSGHDINKSRFLIWMKGLTYSDKAVRFRGFVMLRQPSPEEKFDRYK